MVSFENFARLVSTFGIAAGCGTFFGCALLTDVDETRVSQSAGGSSSSSSSSTSNASATSSSSGGGGGGGGEAGAGGNAPVCLDDSDCPGVTNACIRPRCFSDGLCGFDNEPIGAPCAENGGNACNGKGECVECTANEHCASGKCGMDRLCIPPTCSDIIKNGDETDVDCGGSCLARCGPLEKCLNDGDCVGGVCIAETCAPTCSDQTTNGAETDVDCGGSDCAACVLGKTCRVGMDCVSTLCQNGVCVPVPTCTDGVYNGLETDIDCGGPDCAACTLGQPCLEGRDCTTLSCVQSICAEPTCTDGILNGGEVDIDCGSMCPMGCPTGKPCTVAEDCASKKCEGSPGNTVCGEPSCFDGIWNGDETFYDCGGSCVNKCPPFNPCLINADCRGGLCDPIMLTCSPTCSDGYANQGETDPDCGGPCPTKCPEGWHCFIDDDCVAGLYCTQGHCLP